MFKLLLRSSLASLALLSCIILWPVQADTQDEILAHKKQLEQTQSKITQTEGQLHVYKERQSNAEQKLEKADQALAQARKKLQQVQKLLNVQTAQMLKIQTQIDASEQNINKLKQSLSEMIRAAYMSHETSGPAQLFLSGKDPAEVGRMIGYYGYIARAQADTSQKISQQMQQLQEMHQQAQTQQIQLNQLQQQQKKVLLQVKQQQQKQQKVVGQFKQKTNSTQVQLQRLKASNTQLQGIINNLVKVQQQQAKIVQQAHLRKSDSATKEDSTDTEQEDSPVKNSAFVQLKGKLPWPFNGRILASYGQNISGSGGALQWDGLWIAAPMGSSIKAVAKGKVIYSGWLSSYGLIVLVQHDHYYFTMYGHLADSSVANGQTVVMGTVIGHAGTSGGYDKSGVYFQLRHSDNALNPTSWLRR